MRISWKINEKTKQTPIRVSFVNFENDLTLIVFECLLRKSQLRNMTRNTEE
jgi:hypothetical protein